MIAYIGTGLLGSGFVKALLKKGNQVNVWNRTASKAKALEADGAKAFDNIAEAVKGADRIHITVSDDKAVDEVLEAARKGFEPGVIIIDHTTTSAPGAIKRTAHWKELGYTYQHAPVFMGPQNALEGTGAMLVSGDQQLIEKLKPELSAMTGNLMNFGAEVGRAAGMKLIGNMFLIALTGGISDTLGLAKSLDIPAEDVSALFAAWNPGSMIPARYKKILSGQFDNPSWELNMARKDARLMMEQAGDHLAVIPAVAKKMDKWIEKGHGNDDWTIIAKDNL